jgi:hypothetical protein
MQIVPAHSTSVALAGSVAGDAVTDPVELAKLLDVDVDDLARGGALMAADRLGRLQRSTDSRASNDWPLTTIRTSYSLDGNRERPVRSA